jgi:hypothetical protein
VIRRSVAMPLVSALMMASVVAACGGDSGGDGGDDGDDDSAPDAAPGLPTFQRCTGAEFTPEPAGAWSNPILSAIVTAAGAASHSSQDVLAVHGRPTAVVGKFAYGVLDGLLSKDLEGEAIRVWVWDCTSWVSLGTATTDSDGRIRQPVEVALPVGVFDVRLQVVGDATVTGSTLWNLPVGTHLVVSDIDGTLTTSDGEIFREILDGSHVPVAYPSGPELLAAHGELGHVVVYLTGRPYALTQITRDWLADLDFPLGSLHVVDDILDFIPSDAYVGAFKQAYLEELKAAGFVIDLAYGNATTDITAYLGAGLPPEKVWIIGENAGMEGTVAVADSWAARTAEVSALPAVEQPFVP